VSSIKRNSTHALGGSTRSLLYCTDEAADADIEGLTPEMVPASMDAWRAERARADALLASTGPIGAPSAGNRLSVRWNLVKLIQEYARHNGHADIVRERIDGATGE
jgi:hypothetical protein